MEVLKSEKGRDGPWCRCWRPPCVCILFTPIPPPPRLLLQANPAKVTPIAPALAGLLSQDPDLKYLAQRAFITYVRSIHVQVRCRVPFLIQYCMCVCKVEHTLHELHTVTAQFSTVQYSTVHAVHTSPGIRPRPGALLCTSCPTLALACFTCSATFGSASCW